MYFCYFVIICITSPESSLSKDALCQIWWKLSQFLDREEEFPSIIFYILLLLPLRKGRVLQTWIPFTQLCHVCLKLVQRFWRRRRTCEKFTDRRTDRWMTNNRRSEQLTWSFSSGAKKQVNLSLKSETCFHFFHTQRINKNNQHWIVLLYLFFQQHCIVCRNTWLLDKIECLSNV